MFPGEQLKVTPQNYIWFTLALQENRSFDNRWKTL